MLTLCEQCGSIRIVRAPSTPADRFLAILTGKRPFLCRRCGWRGRRNWTDEDLRKLLDYGAGGAETDPALGVLDTEPAFPPLKKFQSGRRQRGSSGEPGSEHFGLGGLDFSNEDQPVVERAPSGEQAPADVPRRRRRRRSRKRPGRRLIAAAIAATAFVVLLVLVLSLAGG